MRAVTIRDGGALEFAEHPDPQPGGGEVLVRVRAAGLNGADMLQRKGGYPPPPGSPADIPGLEFAGEVVQAGPGALRFAEGDRVMGIAGGGGQAELIAIHERQLMPVPDGVDWPAAGGFPEVFTTAHDAIIGQCALRPGERLLVHGAAGGVGTAGVQIGALTGARVTATVRNPGSREKVAGLGAEQVIEPDGFEQHGPFDVILELIGAPNLPGDLQALNTWGRIVVIGVGGGFKAEVNLLALMGKRGTLRASTLRPRPLEEKADTARAVERELLPALAAGTIQVPIAQTFAMADAEAAYDAFATSGKFGKVVLLND
jgi:putative PIG3 family NAD(P)H quinone oxidoreductase